MPTQGWDTAAFAASADQAARLMGVPEFADQLDEIDIDSLGPQTILELQEVCRRRALERADRAVGAMLVWLLAQTNLNHVAVQAFRTCSPDHRDIATSTTIASTADLNQEKPWKQKPFVRPSRLARAFDTIPTSS